MYDELTDLQKTKLNDEQAAILNSKEKYIVVSASPGCGKTFTLVKKIQIDLENQSPNFGIIACSFTREASKQLQDKLGPKTDLSLSFVGTIDSFVLTGIIESFMNRCRLYLLHCKTLIPKEKLLITMPGNFSKANEITRIGTTHPECKTYLHQWLSNFEIGQYEISYCAYVLAVVMIKKMPEVKSFLSARYTGIYVDEAQDMNEFQFELIKALKDECGLKIFLIGDKNQSIYSFRGARPALFSSLVNEGYQNYRISVSVRCEKSIMDFSNRFLDDSYVCPKNQECHVFNHLAVEAEKLNALLSEDVETLWLCRENSKAKELFRYSEKHHFGFVYTRAIDIQDQEFNGTYLRLFEELLKFRMNCTNQIGQFVYSIEDIETVLLDYATEEDVKHLHKSLLNVGKNPFDYVIGIFQMLGIDISDEIKCDIKLQLDDPVCLRHYIKENNQKRIMTIHGAKGLQATRVIVNVSYDDDTFENHLDSQDETFRLYFVAFSRAEKDLHIFYQRWKVTNGNERTILNYHTMQLKIGQALDDIVIPPARVE